MQYQINLHSKSFKNGILYLGWILFFATLWFRSCESSPQLVKTNKIVVPEVKGNFEPSKPTHTIIEVPKNGQILSKNDLSKNDKLYQEQIVKLSNENYELQQKFANETDSLQRIIMYNNATQLKTFNKVLEDTNVYIDIKGIVQGEVKDVGAKYYIKEKTIETPKPKEVKFRLLAGAGLGNSLTFDKPLFNANIGFQNSKGNVLRIGYDDESRIMVGYDFSIFKINK